MIELKQIRRSFLLGLAGLGISQTLPHGQTTAQAAAPQGYVLGPDGGDHLVHFRNPGNIFIKVDPVKGSGNLALGTQQVPIGAGIPVTGTSRWTKPSTSWKAGEHFFANADAAQRWFAEHDQEGVAFEYPVLE